MTGNIALGALAAALVGCAAALAAMETALPRIPRPVLAELAERQPRRARRLAQLLDDPTGPLDTLLLLRTFAEITAAAVTAVLLTQPLGAGLAAIAAAAVGVALAVYLLAGMAGRTVGRRYAAAVALRCAGLLQALTRMLRPLVGLLRILGRGAVPGRGTAEAAFPAEAALRDLVERAQERGVVEPAERDMIAGVFDLGGTLAREVMVPRPDIVFIERTKTVRQALTLALRSGFSRLPVTGDNADDVVGVAFVKDLARRAQEGRDDLPVGEVMRPATFVPDSKPVDELLREMQAARNHLAIVVDEYGGTAGLVTIEDILEEIVGEITDEYDRADPAVVWLDEDRARVTARMGVDDLAELFGVQISSDDADTVAGLLASALGRVPIPGASARVDGLVLTAESPTGRRNRVGTVLVVRDGATPTPRPRRRGARRSGETASA